MSYLLLTKLFAGKKTITQILLVADYEHQSEFLTLPFISFCH